MAAFLIFVSGGKRYYRFFREFHQDQRAPDWEALFNGSDPYAFGPDFQFQPTCQLGVDYWFRLENYRVKFFPTLSYAQFQQKHGGIRWTK